MSYFDYEKNIIGYVDGVKASLLARPLNLGGIAGSGGGAGYPIGGFVGYLPQTRVAYDLSELSSELIPISGASLLDNLNHIRYRLGLLEAGSGISVSGVTALANLTDVNLSYYHSPLNGDVLVYDSATGKWYAGTNTIPVHSHSSPSAGGVFTSLDIQGWASAQVFSLITDGNGPSGGFPGEADFWIDTDENVYVTTVNGTFPLTGSLTTVSGARYVVTAPDSGLPNAIIIPGFAGSPDVKSSGILSYEFDAGDDTPSVEGGAYTILDVNSNFPSHLYILCSGNASERYFTYNWNPPASGIFEVTTKIALTSTTMASASCAAGLILLNSDNTKRILIQHSFNPSSASSPSIASFSYDGGYIAQGTSISTPWTPEIYLKIKRDANNLYTTECSLNGKLFRRMNTSFSLDFTVTKVGYRIETGTGIIAEFVSDWLRAK